MNRTYLALVLTVPLLACTAETDPPSDSSESELVSDARSIVPNSSGSFDVACKDGRQQTATQQQLESQVVCGPQPPAGAFAPPLSLQGRDIELALKCKLEIFSESDWTPTPNRQSKFEAKAKVRLFQGKSDPYSSFQLFNRFRVMAMDDSLRLPVVGGFYLGKPPSLEAFGPTQKRSDIGYRGALAESESKIEWRPDGRSDYTAPPSSYGTIAVELTQGGGIAVSYRWSQLVFHYRGTYPLQTLTCTGTGA